MVVLGRVVLQMAGLVADSEANFGGIEAGIGVAPVVVDRSRRGIHPDAAADPVVAVDLD